MLNGFLLSPVHGVPLMQQAKIASGLFRPALCLIVVALLSLVGATVLVCQASMIRLARWHVFRRSAGLHGD